MTNSKVNNENYILIQGWMVTELKLKGNELLIYAIIYGFSQAENQVFSGSLQYLVDWTNTTKKSVMNCLQSLEKKELIGKNEKFINGVKFCEYYGKKFTGVVKNFHWGGEKSSPNNIYLNNLDNNLVDNIVNRASGKEVENIPPKIELELELKKELELELELDKEIEIKEKEQNKQTKTKRFTKPTLEEVEQYCSERKNSIDAQTFIDYYESKGWLVGKTPMKDWKAAIRNWERRKENNNTTTNKSTYVSPYQYNEEF